MRSRTLVLGLLATSAALLTGSQVARFLQQDSCLDAGGAFGETRVCGNADYAQGSHVRDAVSFWLLVGLTATSAAVGVFAISRLVPERRDDRVPDHDVTRPSSFKAP